MKVFLAFAVGSVAVFLLLTAFKKRKLTYKETMKYFIGKKKVNPKIVKGSLIKQEVSGGYMITQSLLDKDGNVIDGSKMKVSCLDDELLALFKDNNVVIVE